MNLFQLRLTISSIFILLFLVPSYAQQAEREPLVEEKIVEQLRNIAPRSVDVFRSATAKMDAGDLENAVPLYRSVLENAPDFEPALRRLGSLLVATGKREEGLKLCQRAVDLSRSSENLLSLIAVKLELSDPDGNPPKETWFAVYDMI